MEPRESPVRDPVRDRSAPEAGRRQLRGRHDAVLPGRESGDGRVTRVQFFHARHPRPSSWKKRAL
jgi:hypothetical protein